MAQPGTAPAALHPIQKSSSWSTKPLIPMPSGQAQTDVSNSHLKSQSTYNLPWNTEEPLMLQSLTAVPTIPQPIKQALPERPPLFDPSRRMSMGMVLSSTDPDGMIFDHSTRAKSVADLPSSSVEPLPLPPRRPSINDVTSDIPDYQNTLERHKQQQPEYQNASNLPKSPQVERKTSTGVQSQDTQNVQPDYQNAPNPSKGHVEAQSLHQESPNTLKTSEFDVPDYQNTPLPPIPNEMPDYQNTNMVDKQEPEEKGSEKDVPQYQNTTGTTSQIPLDFESDEEDKGRAFFSEF